MKKLLMAAAAAGAAVMASASANETEEFCNDFTAAHGIDSTPCSCVGEVGEADSAVKEAVLALTAPEDADLMDDAVKEALSVCFPDNGG